MENNSEIGKNRNFFKSFKRIELKIVNEEAMASKRDRQGALPDDDVEMEAGSLNPGSKSGFPGKGKSKAGSGKGKTNPKPISTASAPASASNSASFSASTPDRSLRQPLRSVRGPVHGKYFILSQDFDLERLVSRLVRYSHYFLFLTSSTLRS